MAPSAAGAGSMLVLSTSRAGAHAEASPGRAFPLAAYLGDDSWQINRQGSEFSVLSFSVTELGTAGRGTQPEHPRAL